MPPTPIIVSKLNTKGQETWRYAGTLLHMNGSEIVVEAYFDRPDTPFHGVILKLGDRFEETYFTDRWYNILEIHDLDTQELKGWYCNVSHPARYTGGVLSYIDLALDLFVYADGRQLVLDEDEFTALELPADLQQSARRALSELQNLFTERFSTDPGS